MIALLCALALTLGAPSSKVDPTAAWPRALVMDKVEVPVPPGFDRELRPLGARAAMLSLTDGSDTVIVTVYADGAPDALRVHREELQRALGAGPSTSTKRLFLGRRRATEVLSAHALGVEVVAEVVAADLGARTVVASVVRVKDGPNAAVLDQVVSGTRLQ